MINNDNTNMKNPVSVVHLVVWSLHLRREGPSSNPRITEFIFFFSILDIFRENS